MESRSRWWRRLRDSTLTAHPVLFEEKTEDAALAKMLGERYGSDWFTIEEAEWFTLIDTPFRDNGHLKRPTLAPAEKAGRLEVIRTGRPGSFTPGTRMGFA